MKYYFKVLDTGCIYVSDCLDELIENVNDYIIIFPEYFDKSLDFRLFLKQSFNKIFYQVQKQNKLIFNQCELWKEDLYKSSFPLYTNKCSFWPAFYSHILTVRPTLI